MARGGVSVSQLCRRAGMSRQNFYQARRQRQRQEVAEDRVLELVQEQRRLHPRMGTRKLLFQLQAPMRRLGISLGRDRLFDLLRRHELLVPPLPKRPQTTFSRHTLPVFTNQIKGLEVTRPNQVWVSDITYLRTAEGYLYCALTTDLMSRKIIGYDVADGLEATGAIRATQMALTQLAPGVSVIHHSDRGCQYCCHPMVQLLQDRGVQISMTEVNHCAENSLAERINGILKQEYGLGQELPSKAIARRMVREAIQLYNDLRPHRALNLRCPSHVHALVA